MAVTKKAPVANGLPVRRQYKKADDRIFGFAPYERRVTVICYRGKTRKEVFCRWFARWQTARRRMIDLAMDNGQVGDVFEVAHIRGLQFCTLRIKTDGMFDIKLNRTVFDYL